MKSWLFCFLLTPAELYTRIVIALLGGGGIMTYDSSKPDDTPLVPAPNFRLRSSADHSAMLFSMGPFYVQLDLEQIETFTDNIIKAREAMREAAKNPPPPTNPRSKIG